MLTMKVGLGFNSLGLPMYAVYQAKSYTVDNVTPGEVHVYLDDGDNSTHLLIGNDCEAYVMNDRGSTVDRIIGPRTIVPKV